MMTVAESWAVIHDWLRQHHPTMLDLLNGPADPAEFGRLEEQVGYKLPDDFQASYLIHDGSDPVSGILVGLPLMSLAELSQNWQMWARIANNRDLVEHLSEPCQSHPPGAVKCLYANRSWLPFAGDAMDFVAIDFDPGPDGKKGQIINTGRNDRVRHVIAGTFEGFLAFVAEQFISGRVELSASESRDAPRWLSITEGEGDLLTGLRSLLGLPEEC